MSICFLLFYYIFYLLANQKKYLAIEFKEFKLKYQISILSLLI